MNTNETEIIEENNCIFCKIVERKIATHVVYEDDDFLAFLDVNPLSPGHTLVIPKKHYRWVWDVKNAGSFFEVAKKVALAQRKAFGVEMILSKIVGEEVPHAHIWVFPDKIASKVAELKDYEGNATKIKACLH